GAWWELEAGEVVGLDPARRADGKAGFGAAGNLARGLEVAADERRLGRGEVGVREVVFLAIGHRELHEAFGRFRLAHHGRLPDRHGLVEVGTIMRGDERLP